MPRPAKVAHIIYSVKKAQYLNNLVALEKNKLAVGKWIV